MHFIKISFFIFCTFAVFVLSYEEKNVDDSNLENSEITNVDQDFDIDTEVTEDNMEINSELSETMNIKDSVVGNNISVNNSTVQVSCIQNRTLPQPVEIVNSTRLASLLKVESNVTSRQTPGICIVALFYSPTCPFSCRAAPNFNALSRFFPDIKMVALDAMTNKYFNAQYGIFGTPTLILYHNGRPAARLNETTDYSLEVFAKFIKNCTNIEPSGKLVVTSKDFKGPVSSVPVNEKDYYLLLSWTVIILQLIYSFYCSSWGRWLVDATLSAWREAEAQHHHTD